MALQALEPISVHLSEDALEEYVMGRIPVTDEAHLECHVLVCATCCEKLEELFCFVEAFKRCMSEAGSGTSLGPRPACHAEDMDGQPRQED